MLTSHTLKHARNSVYALAAILVALVLSPGSVRQASRHQAAMQSVAVGTMAGWGGVGDSRLGVTQVAGTVQVFVEMVEEPAVMAWARAVKSQSTQSKIQAVAAARTVARAQLSAIQRSQQRIGATLSASPINGVEIYRVDRVLNGIALIVGVDKIEEIRKIPGVKTVHPLEPEYADTSTSVPFLGLPQLWNGMPGIGNLTGAGLKIGIVDSGIDYQHANFGGTGKLADYQANDRTVITDTIGGKLIFPTAKVVGGMDFAGDAYNGGNVPAPDPDPMDCNGHGTHVAGIAAGFGVKSDGTTYTGPFGPTAPFSSLRIGPGAAPQASLYALRVFGCGLATTLTPQAIDWAIDPDNDGDFSDHLDILNLSIKTHYGALNHPSTIASENAAMAGVIVVAAGGNEGDAYFVTGAPANAPRAISVAASLDSGLGADLADTLASFSSRGPAISSPNLLKPDISAPGHLITSALTGVTCTGVAQSIGCLVPNASGFLPDSQSLAASGTSMATPHISGIMALLRQQHADWTVEELKALVMNTSLHDLTVGANGAPPRYGPGRIGAGRVDPQLAAETNVVAFNADDAGLVSLSFGDEVTGSLTKTKRVRVVNKGQTAVTYNLSFDTVVDAPGVDFSLPAGSTVTVPVGQSITFDLRLNATAAQMDHARDASVSPVQTPIGPPPLVSAFTNAPRHWLTEEAAYLVFESDGATKLRLPVYSSPRPVSMMSATSVIATRGAASGSTTIPLTGADICTGSPGPGPSCAGAFPNDVASLVTPFELQVVSRQNPNLAGGGEMLDIQYAGVAYDATNNLIMFGVSSYGDWATPNQVSYNIDIDFNEDGVFDRTLFNTNTGTLSFLTPTPGEVAQDVFINAVLTRPDMINFGGPAAYVNRLSAASADSALFNNNVMFLAATPAQLGLTGGDTSFRYRVRTCPGQSPACSADDSANFFDLADGPFTWNYNTQGLNFNGVSLAQDLDGASLPVTWNTANMTANGSLGALLLHHHNARGMRAEVVVLDGAQYADLQITSGVSPPNPAAGQNVSFTLTARNNGPNNATNVRVVDRLPSGLTFVSSATSAGSYNQATGVWTIGNLNNSATATLQIVATLNGADPLENIATIVGDSPVDTVPDNNAARFTLMASRRADLALTMDVSSATTLANSPVTYKLTVRNDGDDPAYNLKVTDAFSGFPSLKPSSFKVSAGVYNPTTNIWSLASLGRGFSETLSFTVAAPNMVGTLRNRATVVSDTNDMNAGNDSANAATQVYQLNVALSDPLACTGPDSLLNVTATINTSGMIRQSINVAAQPQVSCQLFVVDNSCSVTGATGTCSTNPSQVSFSGVVSAPTITINYQVRAGDQVAQNADLCVVSNVSAGGDQTGSVTACAKAACPAAGPGDPFPPSAEVSDQKAGSVLIYNIYTSDAASPNSQDSRINITNIDANRSAIVKLFLIDGATCSAADNFICLTPNQTASFLASDLDPGGTGYIVAVAVNSQGRPINFNNLIGDVYVKFASGHAANLGAEAISALGGGPPICDQSSETARLDFDGVNYNRMPRMLALDNIPSSADGADTMIILNSIGGDLRSNADRLTNLFGVFYNDVEAGVSFSFNANACQFRSSVNNSFPRITPRFGEFVPSGRSGWLRLFSNNDHGILGAAITFNLNAGSDANAFNQGNNLHKLTLSISASITIPVFPPNC